MVHQKLTETNKQTKNTSIIIQVLIALNYNFAVLIVIHCKVGCIFKKRFTFDFDCFSVEMLLHSRAFAHIRRKLRPANICLRAS